MLFTALLTALSFVGAGAAFYAAWRAQRAADSLRDRIPVVDDLDARLLRIEGRVKTVSGYVYKQAHLQRTGGVSDAPSPDPTIARTVVDDGQEDAFGYTDDEFSAMLRLQSAGSGKGD